MIDLPIMSSSALEDPRLHPKRQASHSMEERRGRGQECYSADIPPPGECCVSHLCQSSYHGPSLPMLSSLRVGTAYTSGRCNECESVPGFIEDILS